MSNNGHYETKRQQQCDCKLRKSYLIGLILDLQRIVKCMFKSKHLEMKYIGLLCLNKYSKYYNWN